MIFTQIDTAGDCAVAEYCFSQTPDPTIRDSRKATVGGTAGSTPVSVSVPSEGAVNIAFECIVPDGTTWTIGDLTVRLNVTTANMNLTWSAWRACRLDSSCVNQASVMAAPSSPGISLGTTGVKSDTATTTAQTPSNGDKLYVGIRVTNGAMSAQSFSFTPNQNIDSPFSAAFIAKKPYTVSQSVKRASVY